MALALPASVCVLSFHGAARKLYRKYDCKFKALLAPCDHEHVLCVSEHAITVVQKQCQFGSKLSISEHAHRVVVVRTALRRARPDE